MEKTRVAAVTEIDRQKSEFIDQRTILERQITELKSELASSKNQLKQLGILNADVIVTLH
jgi:sugar-specific transcriptional regulator TrmB